MIAQRRKRNHDGGEIAQLVEARFCASRHFSTAALNLLRNFEWPGNLQDLAAAVRTLAATALEEEIGAADVESVLPQFTPPPKGLGLPLDMPLRDAREAFERAYFEHHLALENGSIAKVAEKCGLERTHLYRKLKALGIHTGRREE
jgi:DNA-binding NtrC family response regulator